MELKENAPVTGTQNRDRRRGELAAPSTTGGSGVATDASGDRCIGGAAGDSNGVRLLGDVAAEIVRRLELARVNSDE